MYQPREGWPRTGARRKGAYAAAAGAVHLLEQAKVFDTVAEAIADLNFVWATTARERGQFKRIEAPAVAMAETAGALDLGVKHGIIFGPERTGLDNDDIALASAILLLLRSQRRLSWRGLRKRGLGMRRRSRLRGRLRGQLGSCVRPDRLRTRSRRSRHTEAEPRGQNEL